MSLLASDLIPYSEAATLKGCTPQALRYAAKRGQLKEHRIGRRAFLVRDEAFDAFEVEETGGRLHKDKDAEPEGTGGGQRK